MNKVLFTQSRGFEDTEQIAESLTIPQEILNRILEILDRILDRILVDFDEYPIPQEILNFREAAGKEVTDGAAITNEQGIPELVSSIFDENF